MSPERLQNKPYGCPADVYAFAVIFWHLLARTEPFLKYQMLNDSKLFKKAGKNCSNDSASSVF